MGKKDNLFAGIITFLIILIFSLITYFCLDIFGVIKVPDKFSLVKLLASSTEEVYVAKPIEETVTDDNIDDWINNHKNNVEEDNTTQEEENFYPPVVSQEQEEQEENPEQIPEVNTQNNFRYVVSKMYYSQLDAYGKMIYGKMYDNIENLKTGTYTVDFDTTFNDLLHEENGEEVLERAFQFGMNALLFDHPEIFFLDITKMYMSTEIISFGPLKTYKVSIGGLEGESYLADSFKSQQTVEILNEMLNINRNNVINPVRDKSIYEQIRAVHDYLVENLDYDSTLAQPNIYNIYGAMVSKLAVCEGYAKAFKFMMDDLQIPCVIVCGLATNSNGETESHAWNYVRIEDSWYAVDCTWDDPVIVGTGYISSSIYERYFLKGSDEFFNDHLEDGKIVEGSNFAYPTISTSNYNY